MAAREATEFLGSGPAFPFRVGKEGLPEIEFSRGRAAVRAAVEFLLKTFPGELPFDPALGLDPESLRFDPTDLRATLDAHQLVQASLVEGDPRIVHVQADVRPEPRNDLMNIGVTFDIIEEQVAENHVILPEGGHDDVLRDTPGARSIGRGFLSAVLVGVKP